ncbi:hypothetical protein [Kitasatospora herbaricolor]|uniref:DNA-binding protein n=1 Tax=Kitasatospora herbaricolor TaxID=68217 RepID=A0ABZ1W592_9ACTN|nr:hypothetical protein [Kitasatospora herbaricolor]
MSADHSGTTGYEGLLEAGAVLPAGTLAGAGRPGSAADVLTARSYAHPVLGERRVVRLVPAMLGPAEDLAADFLGLTPATAPVAVGEVRQEALGFPAWALVHDPANGHHALALVKEMERLARQAKSKPGNAKEGFEALAVRLGRAVPQFLPTYCEEVGRIFLEQGNQTYAGTFFGKAREAERTHGLEIDEERLRAVFLEFALAGALTVKALRQYVKELAGRLDPGTAWQRFRQLCTERSAAGMAPYAGVAEDARSLIRAAGLDRAEHEQALLAELLASPAVDRAPGAFWKSWHGALIELAVRDEAVRARLLEILPNPSGSEDKGEGDRAWLAVLAESGAEQLLTGPRPAGAEPAAAWLQRWSAHLGRGWRARESCADTVALAGRMAERLRADGVPVDLLADRRRRSATELNLLDLLLAERVPLAAPPEDLSLDLSGWVSAGGPGRRDLAAVAAYPRLRPALKAATPGVWTGRTDTDAGRAVASAPVLRELFVEWADDRADELLAARGLTGAQDLLLALRPHQGALTAANPAAAERIAGLDVAALLGRALRTGIADELGWPAIDQGLRLLGVEESAVPGLGKGKAGLEGLLIDNAWPNLILARGDKAVVVGPQGVLLEHQLRVPDRLEHWQRPRFRYTDGELLVVWYHEGKQRAYWSNRPAEVFHLEGEWISGYYHGGGDIAPASVPLPGGGRASGGRALHAGDTVLPTEERLFSDGTGYWTVRRAAGRTVLTEHDPATGAAGRDSLPPLFAATESAGELQPAQSRLLPMQPGLEDTPLGTDGAVLGSWVRTTAERLTVTGPDGRAAVLPSRGSRLTRPPVGLLRLPAEAEALLVEESDGLSLSLPDGGATRADRTTELKPGKPGGLAAAGTALVPPADHWHALRPRDEQSSKALRQVTDAQAAELIDAAWPVNLEPVPEKDRRWLTVQGVRRPLATEKRSRSRVPVTAVAAVLPEIGHPLLAAGVAGLARIATDTLERAARFVPQPEAEARREPGARPAPAAYRPEHGRDHELREAVGAVLPGVSGFGNSWNSDGTWHVLGNLRTVAALLAAGAPGPDPTGAAGQTVEEQAATWTTDPERIALTGDSSYYGWVQLLGRTGPLALAAAGPATTPERRASLALLITELNGGGLADRGATLREVTLSEALDPARKRDGHTKRIGQVLRHGDRTVVVLACYRHTDDQVHWLALDHDPAGGFGPVDRFGIHHERRFEEPLPADWTTRFTALLREHGGYPWQPGPAAAFGEATGIGANRATLLLSAPPGLFQWYGSFLDAALLKQFGLRSTEAAAARGWLRSVGSDDLYAVWTALLPADPARLWSDGPDAAAGAEEWLRRIGRVVTLPAAAQSTVSGTTIQAVEAMLNPGRTAWLTRTTRQRLRTVQNSTETQLTAEDPSAVPGRNEISGAVEALRWLAYHLPYGDELRPHLPLALAALRSRLADPGLLLDYDLTHTVKGEPLAPVLRTHAGLPEQGGAGADGLVACGEALVLAPGRAVETAYLRPSGLSGVDDPVFDLIGGLSVGYWFQTEGPALRAVLGDELRRLVEDGAGTAAGWAQDPQLSVPTLVTEAAEALGLGQDAAALYLQLLALPDPTDRNVARWTGWKPARLKKARAELAATDLVLEAKRARAGRSLFLPGGWQEARTPGLPAETWKSGLYELPHGHAVLPHHPVPELFARAWQRVRDGDTPGYEELRTSKRKKGRR